MRLAANRGFQVKQGKKEWVSVKLTSEISSQKVRLSSLDCLAAILLQAFPFSAVFALVRRIPNHYFVVRILLQFSDFTRRYNLYRIIRVKHLSVYLSPIIII